MQLTDAATNRPVYYHKETSRMIFSRAEMFLKSPPVTPCRQLQEVQSFKLPDEFASSPFPPTHREGIKGTNEEEAIKLLSLSSSLSSISLVDSELTISQTQKLKTQKIRPASIIRCTIPIWRLRVSKVGTLTHHSCIFGKKGLAGCNLFLTGLVC
jgi:hypothetical protein